MRRAVTGAALASRRISAKRPLSLQRGTRREEEDPTVRVTTLPNQIRVATEATPGHFASVGLYVDAGSRYETEANSGTSHFLDRMAYQTTTTKNAEEMSSAINVLGGQILASSSRESIMYQSTNFPEATPLALSLIADTALNAGFLPGEIMAQREAARYEIRELNNQPDQVLPEVLHQVAYGGATLGNPLFCPEHRVDSIDAETLRATMREWYRPERMVIAGSGIVHEELVELVDKYFSSLKGETLSTHQPLLTSAAPKPPHIPTHLLPSSSSPSLLKNFTRAASSYFVPSQNPSGGIMDALSSSPHSGRASYTGGHLFIHKPDSEFNHVYLAFEGVGIHDDDIYALAVMQVLLGGGGSFSAGGPGKGMYSRLYTHILNLHPQIDHCASFNHIYTDSSLFGLFANVMPATSRHHATPAQVLPHLVNQLSLLIHTPVRAPDLSRAKNQLKSSLVMALESKAVEVEDLGKQMLAHNRKVPVSEMCDAIDRVTPAEVQRVASRTFGVEHAKPATIVVQGREDVGDWQAVLEKYGVGGQLAEISNSAAGV